MKQPKKSHFFPQPKQKKRPSSAQSSTQKELDPQDAEIKRLLHNANALQKLFQAKMQAAYEAFGLPKDQLQELFASSTLQPSPELVAQSEELFKQLHGITGKPLEELRPKKLASEGKTKATQSRHSKMRGARRKWIPIK
jgi:hypothetical protein